MTIKLPDHLETKFAIRAEISDAIRTEILAKTDLPGNWMALEFRRQSLDIASQNRVISDAQRAGREVTFEDIHDIQLTVNEELEAQRITLGMMIFWKQLAGHIFDRGLDLGEVVVPSITNPWRGSLDNIAELDFVTLVHPTHGEMSMWVEADLENNEFLLMVK